MSTLLPIAIMFWTIYRPTKDTVTVLPSNSVVLGMAMSSSWSVHLCGEISEQLLDGLHNNFVAKYII